MEVLVINGAAAKTIHIFIFVLHKVVPSSIDVGLGQMSRRHVTEELPERGGLTREYGRFAQAPIVFGETKGWQGNISGMSSGANDLYDRIATHVRIESFASRYVSEPDEHGETGGGIVVISASGVIFGHAGDIFGLATSITAQTGSQRIGAISRRSGLCADPRVVLTGACRTRAR